MKRLAVNIINHLPQPLRVAAYTVRHTILSPTSNANDLRKQKIVLSYIRQHKIRCFIETGTCFGEMTYAVKDNVDEVYSIEIDDTLYKISKLRFLLDPRVHVLRGDSGQVLNQLLPGVEKRCLFWLDAHYSGTMTGKGLTDTPILRELESIRAHSIKNHLILIDDIRCFGSGDYPPVAKVCDAIERSDKSYRIEIKNDILRAVPGRV